MSKNEPKDAPKVDVWGYEKKTGEGKIFQLANGEDLPPGYVDSPAKCDKSAEEKGG